MFFEVFLTDDWLSDQHLFMCEQAENSNIKYWHSHFQRNNNFQSQKSSCMSYRADNIASHDDEEKIWSKSSESKLQYLVATSMNKTLF